MNTNNIRINMINLWFKKMTELLTQILNEAPKQGYITNIMRFFKYELEINNDNMDKIIDEIYNYKNLDVEKLRVFKQILRIEFKNC